MDNKTILTGFNNHLEEFLKDIETLFPEDFEIKTSINYLKSVRKMNPKLVIVSWKNYISTPYKNEILCGNIDFFMKKDYNKDLEGAAYCNEIISKIEMLRRPISEMGDDNLNKTVKYIQNLTKLCELYV
jgi:hypothetical protein